MSIPAYERREALLDLKEKLLLAEEQRLTGEKGISLRDVEVNLRNKINGKYPN
ncbi:hypothetical protein [Sporosarcina sp. OR05]|uniref:hypothetical protein n=1 Tax=Sporosarcina sp. OR05 TaxID=2969819 RepID=UPI00352B2452